MRIRIEPPQTPTPVLRWKWDDETDILSGVVPAPPDARGLTTSLEITDAAGSVIVVDVTRGLLCGLDMVVWPDVDVDASVKLPAAVADGSLVLSVDEEDAVPAIDVEGTITVRASFDETLYHVRLGDAASARRLRIADQLVVELDAEGALAGFWLIGVPPYVPPDDDDF